MLIHLCFSAEIRETGNDPQQIWAELYFESTPETPEKDQVKAEISKSEPAAGLGRTGTKQVWI